MGQVVITIDYSSGGSLELTRNIDDAGDVSLVKLDANPEFEALSSSIRAMCSDIFSGSLNTAIDTANS